MICYSNHVATSTKQVSWIDGKHRKPRRNMVEKKEELTRNWSHFSTSLVAIPVIVFANFRQIQPKSCGKRGTIHHGKTSTQQETRNVLFELHGRGNERCMERNEQRRGKGTRAETFYRVLRGVIKTGRRTGHDVIFGYLVARVAGIPREFLPVRSATNS